MKNSLKPQGLLAIYGKESAKLRWTENTEHPSVYTKNYILIPFNPRFNMF